MNFWVDGCIGFYFRELNIAFCYTVSGPRNGFNAYDSALHRLSSHGDMPDVFGRRLGDWANLEPMKWRGQRWSAMNNGTSAKT